MYFTCLYNLNFYSLDLMQIGANRYTPVCQVEGSEDPRMNCVHNLKRYGRVAFESVESVLLRENFPPLAQLKAVGPNRAVWTSFIVSEAVRHGI